MAGVNRHRRSRRPVPLLRQAAHLHTLPPAATTLMEATYPASSMKHIHTYITIWRGREKHSHKLSKAAGSLAHILMHTRVLPFASSTLEAFSATASPTFPCSHSIHNSFTTAAAPLVILFMKPFFLSMASFHPQSAQYSIEAVSRLPGRFGGPVSVGEWRASSADHKSGHQFLLRPVSTRKP